MGKPIVKTDKKREQGKLYYVKSDKKGFLWIFEAEMKRGGTKKKKE